MLQERDEIDRRKLEVLRQEIQIGIDLVDRCELASMNAKMTLEKVRATRGPKGPR